MYALEGMSSITLLIWPTCMLGVGKQEKSMSKHEGKHQWVLVRWVAHVSVGALVAHVCVGALVAHVGVGAVGGGEMADLPPLPRPASRPGRLLRSRSPLPSLVGRSSFTFSCGVTGQCIVFFLWCHWFKHGHR